MDFILLLFARVICFPSYSNSRTSPMGQCRERPGQQREQHVWRWQTRANAKCSGWEVDSKCPFHSSLQPVSILSAGLELLRLLPLETPNTQFTTDFLRLISELLPAHRKYLEHLSPTWNCVHQEAHSKCPLGNTS